MTAIPILLSAGEASGDLYAAWLAKELQQRMDVSLFGMGGPHMRAAGVEIITDYSEVSVVGITEVLKQLPSLRQAMNRLVTAAKKRRPPIAVLTDFPGFHLRLARKLRPLGIGNVYYICPQFWAWRPWRANLVRRRFQQALCIFPFEEKFYADAGVPVKFIGHPLVGNVRATLSREEFCEKYQLNAGGKLIAILPGSRRGEIAHHVPILAKALEQLSQKVSAIGAVIAVAPGINPRTLQTMFRPSPNIRFVADDTYNALAASDLAIVSSGTATVETALLGKPMIVVYRLSPLTAKLAKPLVRTKFFSMVNLIAGRVIVPELIQDDFTAERLVLEANRLLSASKESLESVVEMKRGLAEVCTLLGPPSAVQRAAEALVALLQPSPSNAK